MGECMGDFTGICSTSVCVKEEALSFPSEFIKFPLRWEQGSLVNTKFVSVHVLSSLGFLAA